MSYIIAGIGTEIGKTVISALICQGAREGAGYDYWKPVQAGDLENTDTHKVSEWVSREGFTAHAERYRLTEPMSPHAAAAIDGIKIGIEDFIRPEAVNLVTELAGGLMVPLSDRLTNIDLCEVLGDPIILTANFYLGSINHTLLSLELIRARGLSFAGIVFNGVPNIESRAVILSYVKMCGFEDPLIADVPHCETGPVNTRFIEQYAKLFHHL